MKTAITILLFILTINLSVTPIDEFNQTQQEAKEFIFYILKGMTK